MLDSGADFSSDLFKRDTLLVGMCFGMFIPGQCLANYSYEWCIAREVNDVSALLSTGGYRIVHHLQSGEGLSGSGHTRQESEVTFAFPLSSLDQFNEFC